VSASYFERRTHTLTKFAPNGLLPLAVRRQTLVTDHACGPGSSSSPAAGSRGPKGVAEHPCVRTTSPPRPLRVEHKTRRRPVNGYDGLPELMTMDQLAERLGVTHRHVRRLVDERRVPFLRVGRFIRFDPAEIADWLNCNRVPGFQTK
jgi:excisionase family DNA binding protein